MISRARFLGGKGEVIRPPWALAEDVSIDRCSRCDQRIDKCPEKIIVKGRGDFPSIDFARRECIFCTVCLEHCADNALIKNNAPPWQLKAELSEACLALRGVVCVTCKEQCEVRAIQMKHQRGAVAIPVIDSFLCTGCGACYQPCPMNAISLKAAELPEGIDV